MKITCGHLALRRKTNSRARQRVAVIVAIGSTITWAVDVFSNPMHYWDTSTSAGLQSGNGTWDNGTTAVWSDNTGGSDPLQTWTAGSEAVFQAAGGGVVSVNGSVHAEGISITASGYSLVNGTGGQIVLANGGIIHNTASATISAPVTGDSLIRKTGSGYLTFTSIDTAYTGALQVEQGWLGGGPTVANSIQLVVNGGTWGTEGGHRVYGSLSGTGGSLYLWTRTLTVGGNNASTSYDGNTTFTGQSGYLIKSGTGTLTMNGTLGHTGTDQVNAGGYLINGTHAGNIHVNGVGARLGGGGLITGAVTIDNDGILAPGSGSVTGTLHVGSAVFNNGSVLKLSLNGDDSDALVIAGNLQLSSTDTVLDITGSWSSNPILTFDSLSGDGQFGLVRYNDTDYSWDDAFIPNTLDGYQLAWDNNNLMLIPEPSTVVLLGLALSGLMLRRRMLGLINRSNVPHWPI